MQNVKFEDLEELFDFLPEKELLVVQYLRQIILACIPDCTEKLSYNVPYYKGHSNICFIWPASVLWGKKQSYEGVRLGFVSGHLMYDDINYLEEGKRKYVRCRDFQSIKEIDRDILSAYLYDAVRVDEEKLVAKKNKKNT